MITCSFENFYIHVVLAVYSTLILTPEGKCNIIELLNKFGITDSEDIKTGVLYSKNCPLIVTSNGQVDIRIFNQMMILGNL